MRLGIMLILVPAIMTMASLLKQASSKQRQNRAAAIAFVGGDPDKGKAAIYQHGCASCHTIPGIRGANALVGPPLTQIGGRTYIAGVLTNTPDNMVRWLQDPPAVDPKTAMPNLHLTDNESRDIATFLFTLN
jgi:cytochrome c